MFEDSLIESGGKLKTKRGWTSIVSFAIQMCIIGVMVLIPLIFTEALPKGTTLFMLVLNFFLQDLGMFFDFFVPTVMLLGHVVLHKIYEWWKIAHHPVEAAAHV